MHCKPAFTTLSLTLIPLPLLIFAILLGLLLVKAPLSHAGEQVFSNRFRPMDTVYKRNGECLTTCQVITVVGDYVRLQCPGYRNVQTLNRSQVAAGGDTVLLKNGTSYQGNLFYMDERKAELRSPEMGRQAVSRWQVKTVTLGEPIPAED
jgi:hypothetical protein